MDEQVRAFDEAVGAAPLAGGGGTPGNGKKQARAVRPPRRAPNGRAVRPVKPPSIGSALGRHLALDRKRKSCGFEREGAWLGSRFITLVSHDGCVRASPMTGLSAAFVGLHRCFPSRVAPYSNLFRARCASNSKFVRSVGIGILHK